MVAGDFDRREVEAMIRKYFGEIPAREEVEPVRPIPVQLEKTSKYVLEDRFANAPGLEMNFSGAEQFHPDAYPLRILALLLSYLMERVLLFIKCWWKIISWHLM